MDLLDKSALCLIQFLVGICEYNSTQMECEKASCIVMNRITNGTIKNLKYFFGVNIVKTQQFRVLFYTDLTCKTGVRINWVRYTKKKLVSYNSAKTVV